VSSQIDLLTKGWWVMIFVTPRSGEFINSAVMTVLHGIFFGSGLIIAAVVFKHLWSVGFCN
jgi:hypothetical protein